MRNLKKVLSLALALVMLLGMMVVGAGAATKFQDDAEIQNQEAVAVLVGMGIMKGRGDGTNFEPAGTLTRAEAAKMIAQLDLGVEAADALKGNGTSPFSDVWSGYWAEGAIDYCVEQGYITGDGAGHFFPSRNVSSVEFGIMLLRLLGYDAKNEGLVGDQWVSKGAALARKAGLTTSVAANTQPMTRDAMAQMAFNVLTATLVEYNGLNGTIGDATFSSPATPRYHNATDLGIENETYDRKVPTATTTIKFCEEHFPALKLTTDARDGFKREYSVWTWKNVDIANSKQLVKADAEFTAETTASAVSSAINGATGARLDTPVYVNGKKVTTIAGTDVNADLIASWTENGRQVLVYLNETNHKQIKKVVVVDTFVAQVNSVGSDSITLNLLGDTQPATTAVSDLKNDSKADVYSNRLSLLSGTLASRTVKTTGFAAGDLVTYTAAYGSNGKYSIVADDVALLSDPVTGTLTAWKGSGLVNDNKVGDADSSFTVDSGDPYKYSVNNVVVDSDGGVISIYEFAVNKSEINVYRDKYGYAIYVSGVEVAKNYASVIGMGSSNQYGSETRGVTLLLPDGTQVEVTAKMSKTDWDAMTTQKTPGNDYGKNLVTDGLADIVTYTVDDKGVYTLTRVALPRVSNPTADDYTGMYKVPTTGKKPVFANGKSEMKIEGTSYYTTNRTIFMVGSRNTSDNTYSYSVYTGYANAPSITDETTVHGIAFGLNRTLTRQIDVVYIDASGLSNATGNEIYFAFNKNVEIETTNNGSYITVPAVVDGKVEDITISATISKDWDGTGAKELRKVETNGLYVIDSVVRNDAGIITNCTVKAKGAGNDILKAFPAGKQGVVKAGYGVIGFGQANEGDNIFWAYTENSKGYYIDKDYTSITETAIGSFYTDKNDYVWANGDSVNKKVDTLFVVEVEGNEAPVGPSDNEVAITVDIDAGVKSVTVGTTKLTANGTVNVTKNTDTDVVIELNDDYKVTSVTGAGATKVSDTKYTIKTSTTGTLKIETASTKGKTLTLIGSLLVQDSSGKNNKVTVIEGASTVLEGKIEKAVVNGAIVDKAVYNVTPGASVTIGSGAFTASGASYDVDGTMVTINNNSNTDTITFTMPKDKDLTLNLDTADTFTDSTGSTAGAKTAVYVDNRLSVTWKQSDGTTAITPVSEAGTGANAGFTVYYVKQGADNTGDEFTVNGAFIKVGDATTMNGTITAAAAAHDVAVGTSNFYIRPATALALAQGATASYNKGNTSTPTDTSITNGQGVVPGTMLKIGVGTQTDVIVGEAGDVGNSVKTTGYTYQMPTTELKLVGGFKVTLNGGVTATVNSKAVTTGQVVADLTNDLVATAPTGMTVVTGTKVVSLAADKYTDAAVAADTTLNATWELALAAEGKIAIDYTSMPSGKVTHVVTGSEGTPVEKIYVVDGQVIEITGTDQLVVKDAAAGTVNFATYDKDGFVAATDYDAATFWVKLKITENTKGWSIDGKS